MRVPPERLPVEALRDYELIKMTGWTFDQIDNAPAGRLEWVMQVHYAFEQWQQEQRAIQQQRKEAGRNGG